MGHQPSNQSTVNSTVVGLAGELLVVPTFINNYRIEALVDCGSTVNLISKRLIDSLQIKTTNQDRIVLRGFQGTPESTLGSVLLPIEIGQDMFILNAHVAQNISFDVFLGAPFLKDYKAELNILHKTLYLPNSGEVQMSERKNSHNLVCRVLAMGEEQNELRVSSQQKRQTVQPGEVFRTKIEPTFSKKLITSLENSHWILIDGLIDSTTESVLIMNNTQGIATLEPGEVIAHEECVTGEFQFSPSQTQKAFPKDGSQQNSKEEVCSYAGTNSWKREGAGARVTKDLSPKECALGTKDPWRINGAGARANKGSSPKDGAMGTQDPRKHDGVGCGATMATDPKAGAYSGGKISYPSGYTAGNDGTKYSKGAESMHNGSVHTKPNETVLTELGPESEESRSEFERLVDLKTNSLKPEERNIIRKLLTKYRRVFSTKYDPLGYNNKCPMKIEYEGPTFYRKPYRVPISKEQVIEKEINKMLDLGVIRRSMSPYSSPLLVVGKKDGSLRLCVDYRALNLHTKKDRFPLPSIDEILAKLGGACSYSTLDACSGYWQLSMDPASIEKTAFSTPSAHYEFLVVPFGLTNAPSHYQRMMSHLLAGLIGKGCFVFIDDILIYGASLMEHMESLEKVLMIMCKENLRLKLSKCEFLSRRLAFLGHVVTPHGIQPQQEKISAILNAPRPTDKTLVKSFLGLTSYYRKFVEGYSKLAKPLHDVSTKEKFHWGPEQETAFNTLKRAVTSKSLLAHPDFSKQFILTTDASDLHYGCVLSQLDNNQYDRPITFISKSFSKGESKLSIYEKEFLALNFSLKKLRQYLLGHSILWRTDNRSLSYLQKVTMKDPNSRIARWILNLLEYDISIEHVPGKSNKVADYLSRIPWMNGATINAVYEGAELNRAAFRKHQIKDRELGPIRELLLDSETETFTVETGLWKGFRVKMSDDILCQEVEGVKKTLVPAKLREQLIWRSHKSHSTIHPGRLETLRVIQEKFLWPQMAQDINRTVDQCDFCIRNKSTMKPRVDNYPMQRGKTVWTFVHMDLLGPIKVTTRGNRYILSVVDSFSKFMCLRALTDKTTAEVANKFTNILNQYGTPQVAVSDNGKEFLGEKMQKLLKYYKIKHQKTAAYHPQSNGKVERTNRDVMTKLRILCEELHDEWDVLLGTVEMALNNRQHRGTGVPPFLLMFGRTPRLPIHLFQLEEDETEEIPVYTNEEDFLIAKQRSAREVIQRVERKLTSYEKANEPKGLERENQEIDGIVYLDIPMPGTHKMSSRYHGPYVVQRQVSPVTYEVEDCTTGSRKIVHRTVIRKHVKAVQLPETVTEEDQEEQEADEDVSSTDEHNEELEPIARGLDPMHNLNKIRLNNNTTPYNLRKRKEVNYEE